MRGYYREIQFGRLAKATGLYDNFGKSQGARQVDLNSSIFEADNMAHKFRAARGGPDRSALPMSVVAPVIAGSVLRTLPNSKPV